MLNELLQLLGAAIWFILPAYVANGVPVVLGGGRSIDGGRKFRDGRPIFGPGKTVWGFVGGVAAGTLVGLVQGLITSQLQHYLLLGFLLSLGAMLGDLLGSFIKRRLDIPRGGAAPILDQMGFVVFALLLASPVGLPGWEIMVIILVITPLLHLGTNFVSFVLKLKSRPY